jgi:hypothetical protein
MPQWRIRIPTRADVLAARAADSPAAAAGTPPDSAFFLARVLAYIPIEIIGAYQVAAGLIEKLTKSEPQCWRWGVFWVLLVLAPVYMAASTWEKGRLPNWVQVAVSPLAFAVWVFSVGGPFVVWHWYEPSVGALVLLGFAVVLIAFEKLASVARERA